MRAARHLGSAGGRRRGRAGRHPHQPRRPLRAQPRAAGERHDDQQAHHRAGGHQPRRRQGAAAQAPHREAARRRRRGQAAGAHHHQGHREGRSSIPHAVQGRPRPAARAAPPSASAPIAPSASARCWPPGATSSSSTPRTATRAACSTRCADIRKTFPKAADHRRQRRHRRRRRRRWSRPAPTRSRSASARARSARRASSPASACRRSPPSATARARSSGWASPIIADGGIKYSGDVAKAHRRRRPHRDDRLAVRRHRRGAGRGRPLPGPQLQGVPRHGLARRDAGRQPRPLLPGRRRPPTRSWCPRASRGACRTGAACRSRSTSSSAGCGPAWATAAAAPSTSSAPRRASCATTPMGLRESHVHDVIITKEAPNYREQ